MGSQRFHRVYVRNSPRAIALCPTQGQQRDRPDSLPLVLVVSLHQPSREALGPDTGLRASLPDLTTVTVQLEPPAVLRDFVPVAQDAVYGCIGLIYHERDVYMALITDCSFVCRILPHEPVYSLQRVAFLSLTTSRYDDWTRFDSLPSEYDEPTTGPGPRSTSLYGTHPCHTLAQYLASSSFYFSPNADLTRNLQSRHTDSLSREAEFPYNRKYLWNTFMLQPFLKFRHHLDSRLQQAFDEFGVLIPLIQGYATSHLLPHLTRGHGQLTLISRRSSGRAGARFLTRGLDDAGNVANEVETEVTCLLDDQCFSVVILRGSVPVFWEQSGVQLTEHKVQLTRSAEATEPAFQLHLQDLLQRYRRVHVVDLLKERDNSAESVLSQAYQHQIVQTQLPQLIHYTPFDYSAVCRGDNVEAIQLLVKHVLGDLQDYGYFSLRLTDLTVQSHQRGIFRVNCLDCLDRTNVAQNALSWAVFRYYLKDRLKATDLDTLLYVQQIHTQAWVQNGDTLSHQYAGTGALRSNMTRSTKSTWSGMFQDMTKSISRLYQGKMKDPSKQHVMDTLLGKRAESRKIRVYLDSLVALRQQLQRHEAQFLRRHQLTLFVTTFNAGGADPHAGFLNKWLKHAQVSQLPDIFAFGFQEIVDLNVYELMSASSNKPMSWEYRILQELKALSLDGSPNQEPVDYVTLTSEHLVTACLMVFIKKPLAPYVRRVETASKKTGFGGLAGNKGAVALRMTVYDTSLCFLTSHFAAGTTNYDERNGDFRSIRDDLCFTKGLMVEDHDYLLWFGDLNYRVSLPYEEVLAMVERKQLPELLRHDQLKMQQSLGCIFNGYEEGPITFNPTYKFDPGTLRYDTSEKRRVPSWTDRIFIRQRPHDVDRPDEYHVPSRDLGYNIAAYTSCPLVLSDHVPVLAVIQANVTEVNRPLRLQVMRELKRKAPTAVTSRSIDRVASTLRKAPAVGRLIDVDQGNPLARKKPPPPPPASTKAKVKTKAEPRPLPPPSSGDSQWWTESVAVTAGEIANGSTAQADPLSCNPFQPSLLALERAKLAQVRAKQPSPSLPPAPPPDLMDGDPFHDAHSADGGDDLDIFEPIKPSVEL